MSATSRPQAARRYLEASRDAGYTSLPEEAREAHEETMRRLERQHPDLREHAIVGADQDFDKPLDAGLREHQQHLRGEEGVTHGQVLERRKQLRGGTPPARAMTARRRPAARRTPSSRARQRGNKALRETGLPAAAGSAGSTVMQATGIGVALCLAYLILSPKGSGAFSSVLNGISHGLRIFVQPIDPLSPSAGRVTANVPEPTNPVIANPGSALVAAGEQGRITGERAVAGARNHSRFGQPVGTRTR